MRFLLWDLSIYDVYCGNMICIAEKHE